MSSALDTLETWIFSSSPTSNIKGLGRKRSARRAKRNLKSLKKCLNSLGQSAYAGEIWHIAGSKGKGTSARLLAALAKAQGRRVGLFTSPHMHSFKERITLAGAFPPEPAYIAAGAQLRSFLESSPSRTPFEKLFLLAMILFKNEGVDLVVLETGIGGRLDATNAPHSSAQIITSIEMEHVALLGPTLEHIAWEKAGIIEARGALYVQDQVYSKALCVIRREAQRRKAKVFPEKEKHVLLLQNDAQTLRQTLRISARGASCEIESRPLPEEVAQTLSFIIGAGCSLLPSLTFEQVRKTLYAYLTPPLKTEERAIRAGYWEPLRLGSATIVLDVAHTEQSLFGALKLLYAYGFFPHCSLIIGFFSDKNTSLMAPLLRLFRFDQISVVDPPHLGGRESAAPALLSAMSSLGLEAKHQDLWRALNSALTSEHVFICGSFHIVSALEDRLLEMGAKWL